MNNSSKSPLPEKFCDPFGIRRDHGSASRHGFEHHVRHPLPAGGQRKASGGLQQPRYIIAAAGERDAITQAGRTSAKLTFQRTLTDNQQPRFLVPRREKPKRVDQQHWVFLRIESADEEDDLRIGRKTELRDVDRRSAGESCHIDRVRNDDELGCRQPANGRGIVGDRPADADVAIDEPVREAIQPELPSSSLGDAEAADDDGNTCEARPESPGEVGVKQKSLQQVGPPLAEMSVDPQHHAGVPSPACAKAGDRDPGFTKRLDERAGAGEADHFRLEEITVEICGQPDKLLLGAAAVELGDAEGDPPAADWRLGRLFCGMAQASERQVGLPYS